MSAKYLKIKIKHLTAEAKIIRHEEQKTLKEARKIAGAQGKEAFYERACSEFLSMRQHRTVKVRDESRSTQVAYGFIRGKKYGVVENAGVDNPPNWSKVVTMVTTYGPIKDRPAAIKTLKDWSEYDGTTDAGKRVLESIK